jgi:hypothetical protein
MPILLALLMFFFGLFINIVPTMYDPTGAIYLGLYGLQPAAGHNHDSGRSGFDLAISEEAPYRMTRRSVEVRSQCSG